MRTVLILVKLAPVRWLLLFGLAVALAGCGAVSSANDGRLRVVAAENFWGSIAAQLGGDRVSVKSVIHNPATDPHAYEPTATDARDLAEAQLVVINGIGYDPWAGKLLDANPVDGRDEIDVGDLLGLDKGDNPHRWYSPPDVRRVADAITASYKKLDPAHAAYFEARRAGLLDRYNGLITRIRERYAGVPVGASESIVEPLAQSLGLKLLTPSGLMNAVSEGGEPSASDKAEADRQIAGHEVKVWIYNSQNATPDVKRLTSEARAAGIPVVGVTETLTPESATFEQWQSRQLRALEEALG
jgi:zinc/manganese transport system substrate-binding protein